MTSRTRPRAAAARAHLVVALVAGLVCAAHPGPGAARRPAVGVGFAVPMAAGRAEPVDRFGWPLLPRPRVTKAFQPESRPYGPGHRGADLVGVAGQQVLAAGDGVVVYAAPLASRGVVSVDHPGGLRTTYEPVVAMVRPGQRVSRGQVLGTLQVGHPGCPGPACLHWGLRREHIYLDPLLLVRGGHVRLLPYREEGG